MNTECVCPYCKKKFMAGVIVRHNEFIKDKHIVQEVGINSYKKIDKD